MSSAAAHKVPIIPVAPTFVGKQDRLDLEAICIFACIGFFLDDRTYYQGLRTLKPAHRYTNLDEPGHKWFSWHYTPRNITLAQAMDEFENLFEEIIDHQVGVQKVILPLSGGIDSRTQAAALTRLEKDVHAYGYAFEGGHDETGYGKRIAQACSFPFEDWKVPPGYLWNCIENLARINGCYSEFTHPRQMAFVERYRALGDVFSLGHWGDVLFDSMGVADDLPFEEQVAVVLKKIVKKGGLELGTALWQAWGLDGEFREYLTELVKKLLVGIDIPDSANARIRAFKSLYWAPRWTAVNLSVFESVRPGTVPYFDDRICQFICTIPEKYLAGRQIQIEYLKRRAPKLAAIPWQQHRPFNLYQYTWDQAPYNWPFRVMSKLIRSANRKKFIQRNWELQFMGEENAKHLRYYLFENPSFSALIPKKISEEIYNKFYNVNPIAFSHSVSTLLTLSLLTKINTPHIFDYQTGAESSST